MVVGTSFTRMTVPMGLASGPNRRSRNEWLIMATGSAPGRSSSGTMARPAAGCTPSTRK